MSFQITTIQLYSYRGPCVVNIDIACLEQLVISSYWGSHQQVTWAHQQNTFSMHKTQLHKQRTESRSDTRSKLCEHAQYLVTILDVWYKVLLTLGGWGSWRGRGRGEIRRRWWRRRWCPTLHVYHLCLSIVQSCYSTFICYIISSTMTSVSPTLWLM